MKTYHSIFRIYDIDIICIFTSYWFCFEYNTAFGNGKDNNFIQDRNKTSVARKILCICNICQTARIGSEFPIRIRFLPLENSPMIAGRASLSAGAKSNNQTKPVQTSKSHVDRLDVPLLPFLTVSCLWVLWQMLVLWTCCRWQGSRRGAKRPASYCQTAAADRPHTSN